MNKILILLTFFVFFIGLNGSVSAGTEDDGNAYNSSSRTVNNQAPKAIDDDWSTYWQADSGQVYPQWLEINFTTFHRITDWVTASYDSDLFSFRNLVYQYWDGIDWVNITVFNDVGQQWHNATFPEVKSTRFRLITWDCAGMGTHRCTVRETTLQYFNASVEPTTVAQGDSVITSAMTDYNSTTMWVKFTWYSQSQTVGGNTYMRQFTDYTNESGLYQDTYKTANDDETGNWTVMVEFITSGGVQAIRYPEFTVIPLAPEFSLLTIPFITSLLIYLYMRRRLGGWKT